MIGNYVIKKSRFLSDVVMAFFKSSDPQHKQPALAHSITRTSTVVRTGKNAQNLIEAGKLMPYIHSIYYI
jgi:hypothetical protein